MNQRVTSTSIFLNVFTNSFCTVPFNIIAGPIRNLPELTGRTIWNQCDTIQQEQTKLVLQQTKKFEKVKEDKPNI